MPCTGCWLLQLRVLPVKDKWRANRFSSKRCRCVRCPPQVTNIHKWQWKVRISRNIIDKIWWHLGCSWIFHDFQVRFGQIPTDSSSSWVLFPDSARLAGCDLRVALCRCDRLGGCEGDSGCDTRQLPYVSVSPNNVHPQFLKLPYFQRCYFASVIENGEISDVYFCFWHAANVLVRWKPNQQNQFGWFEGCEDKPGWYQGEITP